MARLSPQQITLAGIAPGFAAATAGGDTLANDDRAYLHVKNGSGAAVTVTVASIQPCSQGGTHNAVVNVPAASERLIGPFEHVRFGSEPAVTYSAAASVTVAVFRA